MNLPDKIPNVDLNKILNIFKVKLKGIKGILITCEIRGKVLRE